MRSACSHPWQDSNLQPHVEVHARAGVKVRRRIQRCLWDAEPTGQAGGPFASQDGIEVVGPLALGPGALQQVAPAPHAHPLQHGGRAHVAIVAGRPDPMLASLDEQVVQQPADRLGGVAVALMLGARVKTISAWRESSAWTWAPQSPISRSVWRRATANWNHSPGLSGSLTASSCRNWRAWLGR
jgi:hypothetical protein